MSKTVLIACAATLLASGCGSGGGSSQSSSAPSKSASTASKAVSPNAKEKSPPGDIPDSTQFVRFKPPAGGFSLTVPEGWSRTGGRGRFTFTSNLNSVTVESRPARGSLSVASVKSTDLPLLAKTLRRFKLQSVAMVRRSGQTAVRVRYLALGPANQVTTKAVMDSAERYLFVHNGREAIVTLAGPNGADNIDAWRTMSNSLQWKM
jgi:hypothetical protein